ncbi:hypothetical protein O3M35_008789 [Rhynocoris fuscipes]|uniref:PACRG protein n=1 Tax=Rhynocoris fuscipes TaxID=488301 RepID=A0AAW1D7E5_9HEMI
MTTECNQYANRLKHLDKRCYPHILNVEPKKPPIPPRIVPPFSIQSRQKNTIVEPFPKSQPLKKYPVGKSMFRMHYLRGDIPIAMEFSNFGFKINWKVNFNDLDYHYYLPLFFDGLTEVEHPFKFFAKQGIHDMLVNGKGKVLPVLPQLIIPIKNALNTANETVLSTTLQVIQDLVTTIPEVGEPLVCFYRQILPPLNIYKDQYVEDLGDRVDFGQRRKENISDLIHETLEALERTGGPDAFINIKYMIPTYESCLNC